jgi:hypothetical protein
MIKFIHIVFCCVLITVLSSCGTTWHHATKGPGDLARDESECRIVSNYAGRAASMTGNKIVLIQAQEAFSRCMMSKGWSSKPVEPMEIQAKPSSVDAPEPLVRRIDDHHLDFGGEVIAIPENATLTHDSVSENAGMTTQTIIYDIPHHQDNVYKLEFLFQTIGEDLKFDPIPFPVAEPFFNYAQGRLRNGQTWRAFAGPLNADSWLGGVGSYWIISKQQRVIVSISTLLLPQNTPPPEGVRINQVQADTIDQLMSSFMPWMDSLGRKPRFYADWSLRGFIEQMELTQN